MLDVELYPQTGERFPRSPGAADRYGNPTNTYPGAATASYPCRLRQLKADERGPGDDRDVVTHRLYLVPEAVISRHDRWRIDGVMYEVDGTPYQVLAARDVVHHIEANLYTVS